MKDYNILIVDDDEINRDVLSEVLSSVSKNIYEASDGQEALEIIDNNFIDIILLDLNMPIMNGIDFYKAHKEKSDITIPTIIISSSEEQTRVVEILKLGADDYFVKPFNSELLIRRVRNTINNRRDISLYNPKINSWANKVSKTGNIVYYTNENALILSKDAMTIFNLSNEKISTLDDFYEIFEKTDRRYIADSFNYTLKTGEEFDLLVKVKHKKQSAKEFRLIGRLIINNGSAQKIEIIAQDITDVFERERKINRLDRSVVAFNDIINENNIVSRIKINGEYSYINKMFTEISGYNESEVIGKHYLEIPMPKQTESIVKEVLPSIIEGGVWKGEMELLSKENRPYWVFSYIRGVLDENRRIHELLIINRDITSEKEEAKINLQTAKLVAIGETSAQIFHDVMNPLQIIKSSSEIINLVLEKEKHSEFSENFLRKSIHKIDTGVERIKSIFDQMRSLLTDDRQTEKVDLNKIVNDSIESCKVYTIDKNIKFEIINDFNHYVFVNYLQILQVFNNLIKNSIDAIKDIDEKWIKIIIQSDEKYTAKVSIIDSGKGIDPELVHKIFLNLFTTKANEGGTGLGLGICKKIMLAHGGEISINKNSKNTQFDIYFK